MLPAVDAETPAPSATPRPAVAARGGQDGPGPGDDPLGGGDRRWHLKLRGKVMLLLMFASLGPLLLTGSINVNRSQDQFKRSVRARYAEGARLTATAIGGVFEQVSSDLKQTAARLGLTAARVAAARARIDAGDVRLYLEQRMAELRFLQEQNSSYLLTFLALPDGRVFQVEPYQNLGRIPDLKGLKGFHAEGAAPNGPLLGNLSDLLDGRRPRPVALQPVADRFQVRQGWLGVVLRTEVLHRLMDPLTRSTDEDTSTTWMVVDADRRVAAHVDNRKVGDHAPAEIFATPEPTGELQIGGVSMLYSRAAVPGTRWQVVLLRAADQAYREVSVLHWILTAVIALTLVFVLLLADYLAQVLLRPIRDLERGAQMMGAGALDYRIELASHATDELGRLARNFNEMGENLQRNRQALRAYSRSLENAHAELDALVHGIRNDLKRSLLGIRQSAGELAAEHGAALGHAGGGLVRHIELKVGRIDELAEDLVRLVTRERGRTETSRFPLGPLLEEVRVALTEKLPGVVRWLEPLPELEADRSQLYLVFIELVENGLRYNSSAVPEVVVSAHDEGLDWRIEVSDNGVGIAPADRERIFEVFVRLAAGEGEAGSGTGLTVARRIVEEHRGQLTAEAGESQGARFVLRLPKQPMLLTSPGIRLTDLHSQPPRRAT